MKTSQLTDAQLIQQYREVNARLAEIPGYSMSAERNRLDIQQENLTAEGVARGIIR